MISSLIPEQFHHPERNPVPISSHSPSPRLIPMTNNAVSVSTALPTVEISHKVLAGCVTLSGWFLPLSILFPKSVHTVALDFGMEFTAITRAGATVPSLEMGGLRDELVCSRPSGKVQRPLGLSACTQTGSWLKLLHGKVFPPHPALLTFRIPASTLPIRPQMVFGADFYAGLTSAHDV